MHFQLWDPYHFRWRRVLELTELQYYSISLPWLKRNSVFRYLKFVTETKWVKIKLIAVLSNCIVHRARVNADPFCTFNVGTWVLEVTELQYLSNYSFFLRRLHRNSVLTYLKLLTENVARLELRLISSLTNNIVRELMQILWDPHYRE